MGYLRINKIIYSGKNYYFESEDFDKNIVLIEGDNGTGKSTLCNLIYFALGGEVKVFRKSNDQRHTQITSDTDNYVDLLVTISDQNYVFRRYIGDNDITVIPYEIKITQIVDSETEHTVETKEIQFLGDSTEILPVNRQSDPFIFSDWILEKLGISVVEFYHGYSTFKINFTDLMRLMYHDQQPDPENIYKKIDDKSALVSDSEMLKNAIFELLIGKSYSDYYDSIVKEKKLLKKKALAKGLVEEYKLLADQMRKNDELKNISFLKAEIEKNEVQLDKLHGARLIFKNNRSVSGSLDPDIETYKSTIIENALLLSQKREHQINTFDERYKIASLLTETRSEIHKIEKIIFTHDKLNLFTADTCPYCLSKVEREDNHCVCGSPIEEDQYERFFYTSQEYKEILKSKVKTLETIKLAYDAYNQDINDIKASVSEIEGVIQVNRTKLEAALNKIDESIDVESLNDIDDRIIEVRKNISDLVQLSEMEEKLQKLQDEYDTARDEAKDAELARKELGIQAKRDVTSKVHTFSQKYNELMVDTLPDCRSARIRLENYLPLINDGEYKEASSRVSIRLMYYITMMHLSLDDSEITFPRFLLVDTPETAGIELDNLINCISKFEDLDSYYSNYQVIISTGLNKYPESLKENRVLYMPERKKDYMLLKEKEI
ncbi:AAA family ATPase [Desulfobacula toluolica]|uniref:AAA family ATPase n=1 Tax=Desulfobacula toluolica TaxID=28223 RepID=UPI0002EBE90D|nr:AAA family ATPase [Desulfobacula toluolica]